MCSTTRWARARRKLRRQGRSGRQAMDGQRLIEIGASRMQQRNLAYAFRIFGRPPRTTACDCERAMEPALAAEALSA